MTTADDIIQKIKVERQRQFDLPGSEWDSGNTPGDWVAIVGHYVNSEVRRNGIVSSSTDFQDSLIKAAAVIVAALEHIELMRERQELR
jgi:hypothetical protein